MILLNLFRRVVNKLNIIELCTVSDGRTQWRFQGFRVSSLALPSFPTPAMPWSLLSTWWGWAIWANFELFFINLSYLFRYFPRSFQDGFEFRWLKTAKSLHNIMQELVRVLWRMTWNFRLSRSLDQGRQLWVRSFRTWTHLVLGLHRPGSWSEVLWEWVERGRWGRKLVSPQCPNPLQQFDFASLLIDIYYNSKSGLCSKYIKSIDCNSSTKKHAVCTTLQTLLQVWCCGPWAVSCSAAGVFQQGLWGCWVSPKASPTWPCLRCRGSAFKNHRVFLKVPKILWEKTYYIVM